MIFHPTPLLGAFTIELEKKGDERGFFARTFCVKEFEQYNIEHRIVQINNSFSAHKGTLRGLHYQLEPHAETKIVRCIRGALYDVILDLRKDSSTFGHWYGAELTAENRMMMVVCFSDARG
jgi:dTDP-4-dehydrorhamnose 3,5-epimerase